MSTPAVSTNFPFWQLPVTAVLEQVGASPDGLSSAEAATRLAQFGPNLIHGKRERALVLQFLAKFRNPLVIILLIASALSAWVFESRVDCKLERGKRTGESPRITFTSG
jgi:P-type Mg2+ transporter